MESGLLVIISGVSGSGKSSIVNHLTLEGFGYRVITCTTRSPRVNNGIQEYDGEDYYFLTEGEFTTQVAEGAFVEHATVYGKQYGTRYADINNALQKHEVVFVIVDVQGAETLMSHYPDAMSVFIEVPREEIRSRLIFRGDSEASIEKRLARFDEEHPLSRLFDVRLSNQNDEMPYAAQKLRVMIRTRKNLN